MKALSEPTEAMIKAGDDAMAENIQRSWRGEYDKPGVVWIFQEMLAAAILEGRNSLGHSDQPQTEGAKNE